MMSKNLQNARLSEEAFARAVKELEETLVVSIKDTFSGGTVSAATPSSLTLKDIQDAEKKIAGMNVVLVETVVVTKWAPLDSAWKLKVDEKLYFLINPTVWASMKVLLVQDTQMSMWEKSGVMGMFSGIPVIEDDNLAQELLMKAAGIKSPYDHLRRILNNEYPTEADFKKAYLNEWVESPQNSRMGNDGEQ